jgi:uncharacterized protein YdeI (YjbR/CyaY-like superfamily)
MNNTGESSAKLFRNRELWRKWLEKNHDKKKEIWLVYYKKGSGKKSILYEEAVEEALCFGWIDSTVKSIDEFRYMQKYTPRKEKSVWSTLNKKRIKKLIQEKRITEHGLKKIDIAKKNGSWKKLDNIERPDTSTIPIELKSALSKDKDAQQKFLSLPPSQKKLYLWWIISAKKSETKTRRISETINRVKKGIRAGM